MAHEGQLWEMALEHFGSDVLLQGVVDMSSHRLGQWWRT